MSYPLDIITKIQNSKENMKYKKLQETNFIKGADGGYQIDWKIQADYSSFLLS